jgi:hypothetical protein
MDFSRRESLKFSFFKFKTDGSMSPRSVGTRTERSAWTDSHYISYLKNTFGSWLEGIGIQQEVSAAVACLQGPDGISTEHVTYRYRILLLSSSYSAREQHSKSSLKFFFSS